MNRSLMVTVLVLALFCGANAFAEWRVEIESKTVPPGKTDVTLYFRLYNPSPIVHFALPLVVQEINEPPIGAFWTGHLPVDTLTPTQHGVAWNWANPSWADKYEDDRPGVPSAPCDAEGDLGYDGISPDHLAIFAGGMSVEFS